MTETLPSRTLLIVSWLVLMAMTLVSLLAGDPTTSARLSLLSVVILLIAAGIKARQILWVYLNLQHSTQGWKTGFIAFLLVILGIVLGCAGLLGALAR